MNKLAYICLLCVSCAGAEPFTVLEPDSGDECCDDEQFDTESAQNLDTDTDTDPDTDTDTDPDIVESCPWICRPKRLGDQAACDPWWESVDVEPDWVHNWRFDEFCPGGELCCQPTHATGAGAFYEYCKDLNYPMTTKCKNPYPAYCWSVGNICCPDPE